MRKIFDTHGADSELNERSGLEVEVIRELTDDECDKFEVGNMYRVKFDDGCEIDAFEDEII